jgi:hypothetical protein
MEDLSCFPEKSQIPTGDELKQKLGRTFSAWNQIQKLVLEKYPDGKADWTYSGRKYGWNFRIKDKKRAIIYFLPREKHFKVAFVFGEKATDLVLKSDVDVSIRNELLQARRYAEGRGIRLDVRNKKASKDIEKLIDIKLAN